MRGVAVLLVLLNHAGVLAWGYAGVDIFFVLSGYLITTLLLSEWRRFGAVSFRAFYLRRARRLLPALSIMMVGVSLLERLGFDRPAWPLPLQILTTVFFVNHWVVAFHPLALGLFTPTWSLGQEEQFYLCWPWILVMLLRRGVPKSAVVGLVVVVVVVLAWFGGGLLGTLWSAHGYYDPVLRAAEPLIGCAAALAGSGRIGTRAAAVVCGWLALPLIAVLAAAGSVPLTWKLLGVSLLTAVLVMCLGGPSRAGPSALLNLSPLRYLGRISYGLYLYQEPVDHLTRSLLPGAASWLHVAVFAAVSLLLAVLSWHLVEQAFLRDARRAAISAVRPEAPASAPLATGTPRRTQRRIDIVELRPEMSARTLLSRGQRGILASLAAVLLVAAIIRPSIGWGPSPAVAITALLGTVLALNILNFGYQLSLAIVGFRRPERSTDPVIPDHELPGYAVLVPLYREERVLPNLIKELCALDYPAGRLHILLLIEEDDLATRRALAEVALDDRFDVVVFPTSMPRTKPKACNIGLHWVDSEFVTIYDAEDRPAPDQLRRSVARFRALPEHVVCLQAELQFWNPGTNWLTASFTAEYALRYGLTLHGLDRLRLPIPLGGNSNHFRTSALCALGAWDPFNLTEDADLGMRIARLPGTDSGVRMLDSVTEEEANSELGNWLRQRSRWIKGHLQTWLVHTRMPRRLLRELGFRRFCALHLTLGFPILTALLNPVPWLLGAAWLVGGPAWTEQFLPPWVATVGLYGLIFSYLSTVTQLVVACRRRGASPALAAIASVPIYWLLTTIAAYKGLFQLMRPSRRHYWELTRHGLVDG